MNQEDIQKALEAISKGGITVAGDFVLNKEVKYEVNNVEKDGIGIQILNGKEDASMTVSDKKEELDNAQESQDEQPGEGEDPLREKARTFTQEEIGMLGIKVNAEPIMQLIEKYKPRFTNATDWLIPYCTLRQRRNIPDEAKAYVTAVNKIYNANVCYDNFAKQLKKYGTNIYDWDTSDKRVDKRQRMALEFLEDLRKIKK